MYAVRIVVLSERTRSEIILPRSSNRMRYWLIRHGKRMRCFMRPKFPGKRYKIKLITVFLIIFSVSLAILMSVFFFSLSAKQKSRQRELILYDAASRFDIINAELLTVFRSFSYIQKDDALQKFAAAQTFEETCFNAIQVQKQIKANTLASSRLSYFSIAAAVIRKDFTLVVTPTESLSLQTFASRIGTSEAQLQNLYRQLAKEPFGHNLLLSDNTFSAGKINYLSLQNFSSGRVLFILSIDRQNFKKAFDLMKCDDWMISSGDTLLAGKEDQPAHYYALMERLKEEDPPLSETLAPLHFTADGKNTLGAEFSDIGWVFLAAYPSFSMSPGVFAKTILLPFLLLAACAVFLTWFISKMLYRPIQELLNTMGGDASKESNEFDYIKHHTQKISERAAELDHYLQKSRLLLSEQVFKNALLNPEFVDEEKEADYADKTFVAALAELAEAAPDDDRFSIAKSLLREHCRAGEDRHFIALTEDSFLILLESDSSARARQMIRNLFNETGISSRLELRVALSEPGQGLPSLHDLYKECSQLLEYRYSLADKMFITAEDVAHIFNSGYYYPLKIESDLIQMTLNGTEGALALLEEILHENLEVKLLSPANVKSFFLALVSTLNRIYQELRLHENNDFPDINELLTCEDSDQLLQLIRSTFARIVWMTADRNADIKSDSGERMIDYIHQNYMIDISLDDMAEKLNVSPKYCSSLFKKHTGQTFKKALNEFRVFKAKEIMQQNPEIKISDLATAVGFISANTFIQVFKQYTGTTPRQYALGLARDD